MLTLRVLLVTVTVVTCTEGLSVKLKGTLESSLKSQNTVNILVSFGSSETALNSLNSKSFLNRNERLNGVKSILSAQAVKIQKPVLDFLSSKKSVTTYKSFWILNIIAVENVDQDLIETLSNFEEVEEIWEDEIVYLNQPMKSNKVVKRLGQDSGPEWGINAIRAPQAWFEGYNGSGIIIGSIDTGARGTHEAIKHAFVGKYGWYDPHESTKTKTPTDTNGHGTHTIGTMIGTNGIGVAPGAKWMSCRAFLGSTSQLSIILSCFQFMFCPFDVDGTNSDCTKAPHIVNNSWGSGGANGVTLYNVAIRALHAVGIIPVWASGNEGKNGCSSTKSPGDGNVLSIGSVGQSDSVSYFSGIGPGGFSMLYGTKPDLVAPGEDTLSAGVESDNLYIKYNGTSMATPHVSGAIAILLQKNPNLTYDEIRKVLIAGADPAQGPGLNCGGIPESTVPNHAYGHGRINTLQSLTLIPDNEDTSDSTDKDCKDEKCKGSSASTQLVPTMMISLLIFKLLHSVIVL